MAGFSTQDFSTDRIFTYRSNYYFFNLIISGVKTVLILLQTI